MLQKMMEIISKREKEVLIILGEKELTYLDVFRFYILPKCSEKGFRFLTSGSTGEPKAVYHDFDKFLERYKVERPGYRTVITLDLERIGGFDAMMHVLFYGGLAIIPKERVPSEVIKSVERYAAELLITTPTMLRCMLLLPNHTLSSLKIISYGSEKMSDNLLKELEKAFPNVKLKQTYGLTEIGTMRTHSEGNLIKILDRDTDVRNGVLYVKDNGIWVCTGDRVEVVGDFLKILGRDSAIINVGGNKVQAEKVEEVLMDVCSDSLVYGESNELMGQIVVADVVSNNICREDIIKHCKSKLSKYEVPVKINFVDKIEYVGNGKKRRR